MRRFLAVAAACALSSGCAVMAGPYHRPAAPVPAQWPQGPAYAQNEAGGEAAADIPWRTFFADPKLTKVIETALRENRDLRVAVANIKAARGAYEAQRASLLPTIAATLGGQWSRVPAYTITPGATGHVKVDGYTGTVGLSSYEVDLFGRVASQSKSSRESYLAEAETRRAVQISLIAETAADYLTVAADRALAEAAARTMKAAQESYDLATKRFEGGVASELDVRQAETLLQQARADSAAAVTRAAQAKNALDLVVGAPIDEGLLASNLDDQKIPSADVSPGLSSSVLLMRPDVLTAEHELKAAHFDVGAARAAFFPTIALTAATGGTSLALADLFKGESSTWSFTPAVSMPLFTGGKNLGNLKSANAKQRAALAQYEKAIQSAFRDVADALADRGTIDERADAIEKLEGAARVSLKLASARYERGVEAYLTLLDSQRTYYSAQQSLIAIKLERAQTLITLYRVLGGGLDANDKPAR